MAKKNKDGVYEPIKREMSDAEMLPTAAEQRPKEDEYDIFLKQREKNSRNREEEKKKPIGKEEIAKARQTMMEYFNARKVYDERYKANFDVYNLMYSESKDPQFVKDDSGNLIKKLIDDHIGGQTLNVIMNKHADAMDNYPEPVFLPREKDDEKTAEMLNCVVPCILERNNYEKTYSEVWTDKLVGGAGIVAVTWDASREYGLGDICITKVDLLSVVWEPFVNDIQDSANFFCVNYDDVERVKEAYPQLKDVNTEDLGLTEYKTYDSRSKTDNKAAIIDWYYKKDGMLQLCKFCGSEVLFSSENERKEYPNGFYEHGKYPFVQGSCFSLRDTPVGFGFVDICRAPQRELDGLKHDILENIKVNSQTRNLVDEQAGVNVDDLRDLNKKFIKAQNLPSGSRILVPLESKDISPGSLAMYNAITDEIKMTTGTNDASNGASAAGVTSGSAIAALQEAGGKISRDINKGGFREFREICELIIELIRQFYTPARVFRITGENNKPEYVEFGNEGLRPKDIKIEGDDTIYKRLPIFDIEVKAQRSNPFTTAANNQMMIDMFRMGAFAPENADAALGMLECMMFEGKDKLVEKIKENAQMLQALQQMQGRLQMQDAMIAQQAAQNMPQQGVPPQEAIQMPVHQSEGAKI